MIRAGFCKDCGEIEYDARVSEPTPLCCPRCFRDEFKGLIAGKGAFRLKGCGWAVDGYNEVSHPRFGKTREGRGK